MSRFAGTWMVVFALTSGGWCGGTSRPASSENSGKTAAVNRLYEAGIALAGSIYVHDDAEALHARTRELAAALANARAQQVPSTIVDAYAAALAEGIRMRAAKFNSETFSKSSALQDVANAELDKAEVARKEALRLLETASETALRGQR